MKGRSRRLSRFPHELSIDPGLMDQQADLLERAGNLMRDPLTAFRSADDEAIAEDQ
jgi:hypothetical protein